MPGNLLFDEGKVISVTASGSKDEGEVVAYPQLKVKIAEMDDRIAKNPNDPDALTERGELRLDKGDLSGAIDDLSTALKNNPDKELRDKARAKLYDTLTVYIADHFNDAEKYLEDYEESVQDRSRWRAELGSAASWRPSSGAGGPPISGWSARAARSRDGLSRRSRNISNSPKRPASSPSWCPLSMTGRSRPRPMSGRAAASSP